MMAFTWVVVEAASVFAAGCLLLAAQSQPSLLDSLGTVGVVGPALSVSLCSLVSFYYSDLPQLRTLRDARTAAPRFVPPLAVAILIAVAAYAMVLDGQTNTSLLVGVAVALAAVLPLRAASYGTAGRAAANRVLILGTGPLARKITAEINQGRLPYDVVGIVDDAGSANATEPAPARRLLWPIHDVEAAISELQPDCLIIALTDRRGRLPVWKVLSGCAAGLHVEDGVAFYERVTRKLAIESLSPSFLIFHRALEKTRWQMAARRVFSMAVAAVGLVLTAPVMAFVAVLVKLDSRGPVFFVQERVGLRGRIFRLIKFRTMEGPPPVTQDIWRRDDGARLTRLGRWLRDLHLDELPQFVNVLKGDMDMVGPRPEMACNVAAMTEHVPYYGLRHIVRPGVTGWAQIKQGYSVTLDEVTEKMRYDLYYIKNMSLWFDLRILLTTARIVVFGRKTA